MDIDCDGDLSNPVDGRCGSSDDTQGETRWKAEVQTASNHKIKDLNANIHPYVVFGNERDDGGATFDPRTYGVKPLSVMAVVCGDKLVGFSLYSSLFLAIFSLLVPSFLRAS